MGVPLYIETIYGHLQMEVPNTLITISEMKNLLALLAGFQVGREAERRIVLVAPDREWVMAEGDRALSDYGVVHSSCILAYWSDY